MSKVTVYIEKCDGSEYVLFPACAYNGNRFESVTRKYSPRYTLEEAAVDMETIITDVPRLNKDGSGKIQVTTGDVSVPCVGVFNPNTKKAIFVYTVQEIDGENIGLGYEAGEISLTYPALREEIYMWPKLFMHKNEKPYIDKEADIPYKVIEETCESIKDFYEIHFKNRKIMVWMIHCLLF